MLCNFFTFSTFLAFTRSGSNSFLFCFVFFFFSQQDTSGFGVPGEGILINMHAGRHQEKDR